MLTYDKGIVLTCPDVSNTKGWFTFLEAETVGLGNCCSLCDLFVTRLLIGYRCELNKGGEIGSDDDVKECEEYGRRVKMG